KHHRLPPRVRHRDRRVDGRRFDKGPRTEVQDARDVPRVAPDALEGAMATRIGWSPGPAAWKDDLSPISAADWNVDRAAHLLAHAGFSGTPDEIEALAQMGV